MLSEASSEPDRMSGSVFDVAGSVASIRTNMDTNTVRSSWSSWAPLIFNEVPFSIFLTGPTHIKLVWYRQKVLAYVEAWTVGISTL